MTYNKNLILDVKDMNVVYNGKKILIDANFSINAGEIILFIGSNGSGKSSIFKTLLKDDKDFNFIRTLSTLGKPTQKTIMERKLFFLNENIDNVNKFDNFLKSISYVKQQDEIFDIFQRKAEDYVLEYASTGVGMEKYTKEDIKKHMLTVLAKLRGNDDEKANIKFLNKSRKKYSGGEKRIISLLAAFSRINSKLFIFDEPTNGLDNKHSQLLNNYIIKLVEQKDPPGIIIITHIPFFQIVNKTYMLKNAKLELCNKKVNIYDLFGNYDENTRLYEVEE